jgi:hypothetical protein
MNRMHMPDNNFVTKNNRKNLCKQNEHVRFHFHLGVLIFSSFFKTLTDKGLGYIKQWLIAILLGAQNIEQTKFLHYSSLKAMLDNVVKHPISQRYTLKQMATAANRDALLCFNGELVKVIRERDFYYDPHTKHYTGQLKILATWCPSVRLADKGINMDFIHTVNGFPVYFDTADNFYDLRERFKANFECFRVLMGFPDDIVLTTIIDRGIFSTDILSDIVATPNQHIITWEKGYAKDQWDQNREYKMGGIIKTRNRKQDVRLVHYKYQDGTWEKVKGMRRIVVRVLDKNWDTLIEVSILTDDQERDAREVIELMLKRWVQENDFKYLIKHFGINQITTYAFVDYKDIREKIEDKLYTGGQYKELTRDIQRIRAKLKTALLRKYKFQQKHKDPEAKLPGREEKRKIWLDVSQLDSALKQLEQQRKDLAGKTSKIEELINEGYKKLDTDTKSFVDAIKILARNIFYLTLQSFKEKYNNYRDDHQIFRNLTTSEGEIKVDNEKVVVTLMPTMEYSKKTIAIILDVLNDINQTQLTWPNGSNKKIVLDLAK